jgi:hypothetical protein
MRIAGAGPVHAQPVPVPAAAPDGALFQSQSKSTQDAFTAIFGSTCGAQEWLWQHSLAVDADDMLTGPAASDGQTLAGQDDDIQLVFVAGFGPMANAEWVAERNAFLAHKVLLNTVAPVPCPAAQSSRPQEVIGTSHLSEAVESAREGDIDEVLENFLAFGNIWNTTKADVVKGAPTQAQAVQTAFDQANALLGDPKQPAPPQAQYSPALQALLRAVRTANTTLAGGAAPAAAAGPAPQIRGGDLGEAVDAAGKSDLTVARREFGEFDEDWDKIEDSLEASAPAVHASVDAAVDQVSDLIGDASKSPPQSQYYPALQNLQKVVQDANTTLSSGAAPAPAAPAPAAPAPAPAAPAAAAPAASAGPGPEIASHDLGQAVDYASKSDLAGARKEFGEFSDDWDKIADAVKAAAPAVYASVDDAADKVNDLFTDVGQMPAQPRTTPRSRTCRRPSPPPTPRWGTSAVSAPCSPIHVSEVAHVCIACSHPSRRRSSPP